MVMRRLILVAMLAIGAAAQTAVIPGDRGNAAGQTLNLAVAQTTAPPAVQPGTPAASAPIQVKVSDITITCNPATGKCTPTAASAAVAAPVVSASNWFAVGATTTGSGAPGVNLTAIYAHKLADQSGMPLWSWSQYAVTHVQARPFQILTSATTGFAKDIEKAGPFWFFVMVNGGMAQTSTSTGYALSEGGGMHVKPWKRKPWTLLVAWQPTQSSVGGHQTQYVLSFGRGGP